jgi:hypothetical protein
MRTAAPGQTSVLTIPFTVPLKPERAHASMLNTPYTSSILEGFTAARTGFFQDKRVLRRPSKSDFMQRLQAYSMT